MTEYVGERILELLVDQGEMWPWRIARYVGGRDGRSVTYPLKRLERAGLIERPPGGGYRATARGREVDAIMRRITVRRGGSFQPRTEAGVDVTESVALR
jgi:Mn-dependent DtxR family transcriptional regulator